jgi:hypothetical protein
MTPQLNVGNISVLDAEGLPEHGLIRPLDVSGTRPLARLLSRVLRDEPHFSYMLPDPRERRRVLSWFFKTISGEVSIPAPLVRHTNKED